jgi:hypothetical protein
MRQGASSKTTIALRIACILLVTPHLATAQQTDERLRRFPPQRSLQVGLAGVVEDGHSSRRISLFWNASESWVPGLTATFGQIDIIEPELRWFPNRRDSPFFLSTSVIYRDFGVECLGGSFALGLDTGFFGHGPSARCGGLTAGTSQHGFGQLSRERRSPCSSRFSVSILARTAQTQVVR